MPRSPGKSQLMSVPEGEEMTGRSHPGVEGHRRDRGKLLKMTLKMSRGQKKKNLLKRRKQTEATSPVYELQPKDGFSRAA